MAICVGDVMNRFVVAVGVDAAFSDVVTAMCRFHVDAVPVVDRDRRVLGVVRDDLLLDEIGDRPGETAGRRPPHRAVRRGANGRTACQIMTSPAITVTEDTELRTAARLMRRHGVRQLPVVDGPCGRIIGLVTQSDLLRALYGP
ncbi:CBS domain-containing protein [Microbispora sp. RL4-1S]|uniref:CBS domain-containing protein n=1 Tax=Microbispora oryzae TaxID=2806554 RepID=A0A940WL83_9ACTN|nr:CBS domain-containing protein [Microbispora oryzae]MBP2703161.1 CBS domain-containing protein [Microbispora oryzae]